jgi:glycosyltransferase involved in cell wall biosynthesis
MTATGPLVSFIMPVWAPRPEWLRAAIESVLAQRDCNLELIVVDDGNPAPLDQTLLWLDDPRVSLIRADHGGPSQARNIGISAAQGTYLRFVDADDVLQAGSTARLQKLIGGADDVIAYGTTLSCDEQLRGQRRYESHVEGAIAKQCLLGQFDVLHVSMLFPRAVFDRIGKWNVNMRLGEDSDFVLRAIEHARVRCDRAIETFYRRHGQSTTRRADIASGELANLTIIERYMDRHPNERNSPLHKQALVTVFLDRARAFEYVGDYRSAYVRMARVALYAPRTAIRKTAGLTRRCVKSFLRHRLSPLRIWRDGKGPMSPSIAA